MSELGPTSIKNKREEEIETRRNVMFKEPKLMIKLGEVKMVTSTILGTIRTDPFAIDLFYFYFYFLAKILAHK